MSNIILSAILIISTLLCDNALSLENNTSLDLAQSQKNDEIKLTSYKFINSLEEDIFSQVNIEEIINSQENQNLGAGSTGGGQSTLGFLRDIMSEQPEYVCDQNMSKLIQSFPTFKRTLDIIAQNNIAFAISILSEVKKTTICMVNGKLSSLQLGDQNGIIQSNIEYDQPAIRVVRNDNYDVRKIRVYLDKELFENLNSEEEQSFLLLHEMMHSFVKKTPQITYVNRLRNLVRELYIAYKTESLSLEDLNRLNEDSLMVNYITPNNYIDNIINYRLSKNKIPLLRNTLEQVEGLDTHELKEIASKIITHADFNSRSNFVDGNDIVSLLVILEKKGLDYTDRDIVSQLFLDAIDNYEVNLLTHIINKIDQRQLIDISKKTLYFMKSLLTDFCGGSERYNRDIVLFLWDIFPSSKREKMINTIKAYAKIPQYNKTSLEILKLISIKNK